MRFEIKKPIKPSPEIGESKTKVKFALFPFKCRHPEKLKKFYWIWLEKYIAVYEYKKVKSLHGMDYGDGIPKWVLIKRIMRIDFKHPSDDNNFGVRSIH